MIRWAVAASFALTCAFPAIAQDMEHHLDHPAPEKLGAVTFQTSCDPAVRASFERAVALLHSFAYSVSRKAFSDVADRDPRCAMALWGMAMTHYHQLWEPPVDSESEMREGAAEITRAGDIVGGSPREHQYIGAVQQYYLDWAHSSPRVRAARYAQAMAEVARTNPNDGEAQIFYALSLIATASPADRAHANQKHAAAILEPMWRRQPQHPGLAHYLIHAFDSAELAPRGLAAARAYSKIAPSAPHALHMPSHIFTRLGLWNDSVASNQRARAAAHAQGDLGEELHAMDYLTYAYLQLGDHDKAAKVVAAVHAMTDLPASQFKVGYAASAMPVRLAVESRDWETAAGLTPLPGSAPKVAAVTYWARALGHSRAKQPSSADPDIAELMACLDQLRTSVDDYGATQTDAMLKEAQAWQLAVKGESDAAVLSLRAAADEEDAQEKLPTTPGPIVPAREQLGELLLDLRHPDLALKEFRTTLVLAPGRRGAMAGIAEAGEQLDGTNTPRLIH